ILVARSERRCAGITPGCRWLGWRQDERVNGLRAVAIFLGNQIQGDVAVPRVECARDRDRVRSILTDRSAVDPDAARSHWRQGYGITPTILWHRCYGDGRIRRPIRNGDGNVGRPGVKDKRLLEVLVADTIAEHPRKTRELDEAIRRR